MVCRVGWLAGTGASALGLVGGLVARIGLVSSTPTFVPVDGLGRPGGFGRLVAAVRIEAAAARCRPFVGIAARVRIILRPRAAARSTLGYGFAVVLRRGSGVSGTSTGRPLGRPPAAVVVRIAGHQRAELPGDAVEQSRPEIPPDQSDQQHAGSRAQHQRETFDERVAAVDQEVFELADRAPVEQPVGPGTAQKSISGGWTSAVNRSDCRTARTAPTQPAI
ncbi:hypothetical protein RN10_1275 [Mycobacterium tuberculosis]|nr:hypothetical protein RN10_1275 [Mycobacterium tuberculosis]